MKYKKSASQIVWILISAGILFLAAFVYTKFFLAKSGEGFSNLGREIGLLGDCDKDTVINRLDACPCDKTELGSPANEGCPEGYKIRRDNTGKEDRTCLDKGCPKVI